MPALGTFPLLAIALLGGVVLIETGSVPARKPIACAVPAEDALLSVVAPSGTTTPPTPEGAGRVAVPILVYHVIRPADAADSAAVRDIAQTPEVFDEEMFYLARAGYHVVTFDELEARLVSSAPLPAKPVILTFDDGWRDQFTYAFPVLVKYGYTATFFVFTNAIGRPGFFSWDDLHAMVAAGMSVAAHSRSHPYLTRIASADKLWDEIAGSKTILEEELGVPVKEFAYPFGRYDATTTALVRAAGYRAARGDYWTGAQSAEKLYHLSALNAPTTLESFEQKFP